MELYYNTKTKATRNMSKSDVDKLNKDTNNRWRSAGESEIALHEKREAQQKMLDEKNKEREKAADKSKKKKEAAVAANKKQDIKPDAKADGGSEENASS